MTDDLPEFAGHQMVERFGKVQQLTVYRDDAGDPWIEDSAGTAKCFLPHLSGQDLMDLLEEAHR